MTLKCDYCRGSLGIRAHRYWRMRYCSAECVAAYQRRLDQGTVGKIRCLEAPIDDTRSLALRHADDQKEAA
jgi:hypothetical protein